MACVKGFGPVIRLLTRFCYQDIANAPSWNSKLVLSDGTRFELSYIYNNWDEINGFAMRSSLTQYPVRSIFCWSFSLWNSDSKQGSAIKSFYCSVKNLLCIVRYKLSRISIQVLKLNSSEDQIWFILQTTWIVRGSCWLVPIILRCTLRYSWFICAVKYWISKSRSASYQEMMAFLMRTFAPFDIDCFASQFNKKCSL